MSKNILIFVGLIFGLISCDEIKTSEPIAGEVIKNPENYVHNPSENAVLTPRDSGKYDVKLLDTLGMLSDLQKDNIKGNPKKIREEEFYLLQSDVMGERTGENTETKIYTENGLSKESFIYDDENNISDYTETIISIIGQKVKKVFYDKKNIQTMEIIYYYNTNGEQDSLKFIIIGKGQSATKLEYDNLGNEIQTKIYDFNNKLSQTALLSYKKNNLVKLILKDANGIDYAISTYDYNDQGDKVKEYYYSGNNILFEEYKNVYTYDNIGNWITKKNYLEKIHFRTIDNKKREEGPYRITLRTFNY